MEKIHKFYSEDLALRVSAVITTDIIGKMCALQSTGELARVALGRALTGALLIASQLREGHRIGLYFRGDGPLVGLFAEASFEGEGRAYCHAARASLPAKQGHWDVGGAIGKGVLTVTRTMPHQKQPHNGIVPIQTGEIGQDLAYYLFQSHQIPSIIALSVSLDAQGTVSGAGGVLVELLPGATENLIALLEEKSRAASSLSKRILEGESPEQLAAAYTHDSKLIPVEHPYELSYSCRCSRERVDRALVLSGKAMLAEMVLKGEDVPVTCEFCGRKYVLNENDLRQLIATL